MFNDHFMIGAFGFRKLTWLSLDIWVLFLKLLFLFVELLLEVLKFLLVLVLLFFRNLRFRWGLQWERQKNPLSELNRGSALGYVVRMHACCTQRHTATEK